MTFSICRDPTHWKRMLMVFITIVAAGYLFSDRFRIGIDPQVEKCIPGYTVYLIDLKDRALTKNATYSFEARGLAPLYPDGTRMVKFLRGIPGDEVEIDINQDIKIGTIKVGWGLSLASQLQLPKEKFMGKTVLGKDQFWFMGTSPLSFDSRYWGTVKHEQIIGRAYPLF